MVSHYSKKIRKNGHESKKKIVLDNSNYSLIPGQELAVINPAEFLMCSDPEGPSVNFMILIVDKSTGVILCFLDAWQVIAYPFRDIVLTK